MSPVNERNPRAQGDLGSTPFVHLVLYLHRQSLSGTLVLERGGQDIRVVFHQGRAVRATGLAAGSGLQDGLLELCNDTDAAYEFWDDDLVGSEAAHTAGSMDPFTFAGHSVRGRIREDVVSGVVDRYRGVKLRAVTEANPARLGLRGLDARLVELLRADALTTDELLSRLPLSSDQVRRVVYLLLVTHLALPEGDGASGSSGVRSAVRPQDAQPSSRPLSDGKLAAARAGEAPAPKSPPAIESQQPRTAAQPQVPRSAATPSRPMPASTPAAALPAWQQLVSTRVASASDAGASKVSTPAFAALPVELLDSTGKLRRAEHLAERRSYAEASRILDEVIASEPKNADALAVRAWILFHTSSGADRPSQPLLESIEAALLANQAHPQALYVKGLVLRRMRRENEALRFFQLALDSNPRHIEAARELRLARMRRER